MDKMDKDYVTEILQTMCGMSDEQLLAEFKRVEEELEAKDVEKEDPEGYARLIEKLRFMGGQPVNGKFNG